MSNKPGVGASIRRRLIIATILPLFILGILATLLSSYALWQISLPLTMLSATSRVQAIAADASENLSSTYLRPLTIAAASLAKYTEVQEQQHALISYSAILLNRFEGGILLLDANGVITAATSEHENLIGEDYSSKVYFQSVRSFNRSNFSSVLKDDQLGQYVVIIATPVLYQDSLSGALIGIILLNEHNWERDLGPTYATFNGSAILLDVSGNIIYHPDPLRRGTNIRAYEVLWNLLALREPRSMLIPNALFSDQKVASFAPIPGTYWGLMTETSFNSITPSFPYQVRVIGPLLLVMLIFIILWLIAIERVSHPLIALIHEASHLSSGILPGQLAVEGPLELRTVIMTFNQLARRVNEQRLALYEFAKQVLKSQEEERRRLSRELHDEIVQTLVSFGQRLELVRKILNHDPEAARKRLNEMQLQVKQAIADVRQMSNDLRPALLEDLGLSASIGSLCDEMSQQFPEMNVEFVDNSDIHRIKPEYELTIYRVVQEALNNIRKHAQSATLVKVALEFDERSVMVSISDNGPGFLLQESRILLQKGHLGLVGMNERAQMFNGKINIQTFQGKGTNITLELDLEHS